MISKRYALFLFAMALFLGFILGRTTHPASLSPDRTSTSADETNESDPTTAYQTILNRYEAVTQTPLARLSYDDQRFVNQARDEYSTQCIPLSLADDGLEPFCKRFQTALVAFNDLNTRDRLEHLTGAR